MGLDMYLTKRTYVKNWEYTPPQKKFSIIVKQDGKIRKDIKPERIERIIESVGYWRKANAIHKWFVDNVQDGDDNCQESYVDKEKLAELLATINAVLEKSELVEGEITNGYNFENGKKVPIKEKGKYIKNPAVAQELLPTQEGFFFGGNDYDEYYYRDLVDTKKILEDALKEEGDFYYQASW